MPRAAVAAVAGGKWLGGAGAGDDAVVSDLYSVFSRLPTGPWGASGEGEGSREPGPRPAGEAGRTGALPVSSLSPAASLPPCAPFPLPTPTSFPGFGGCRAGGLPLPERAGGTSLTRLLALGPIIERRREGKKEKKNPVASGPGGRPCSLRGLHSGFGLGPPAPTPAPGGLIPLLLFPAYVSSPFPSWPTSCASVNPLPRPSLHEHELKNKPTNPVLSVEPCCLEPLSPPPGPIPSSLPVPGKGVFSRAPPSKGVALRIALPVLFW